LAGEVLGAERASQLLERVNTLEAQADLSEAMRLSAR
jgi:hypothetical protein